MEGLYYNAEINVQILISLMKAHGIKKIIISPGATNIAFGASVSHDSYFEIYSSVDERSAAYMACGMASESGEPVALSCTGATASRNYLPGLTEAFYRKLPVLAITSSQRSYRVGVLEPQVTDRSNPPRDAVRVSLDLPILSDMPSIQAYVDKVNSALLELRRGGGGPVHINLQTTYSRNFGVKELPSFKVIKRYFAWDKLPALPKDGLIAITVGSHKPFSKELETAIDRFCAIYDAVVFVDHSSSYKGKYKVLPTILACQRNAPAFDALFQPRLLIHIGEQSGDYYTLGKLKRGSKEVWRVSPDGEVRNTFGELTNVFEMSELEFFTRYVERVSQIEARDEYLQIFLEVTRRIYDIIPEVPFSNVWLAKETAPRLLANSVLHLGILNSLRVWNFFDCPASVTSSSNVGGFGIDGSLSAILGASLAAPDKIFFGVVGDLAFFYDMNALGNRHVGHNLRILLVNNGRGTEFRMRTHYAALFGAEADPFIAAAGHFGNQSRDLVRHYAQDLGFEYLTASNKEEYLQNLDHFLTPQTLSKSIIFEVFTNHEDEDAALYAMLNFVKAPVSKSTSEVPKKKALIPSKKARLGFGVMRMPYLENGDIDIQEALKMVDEYMKGDFCYFDTHPAYCKRLSQSIVREMVVKRYPRERFLLADKMPWPIKAPSEYEKIFVAELKDCGVKYFDYYLLHALSNQYYQMHEKMGGFEFLKMLKANGYVRRIGFSFHDKPEVLEKILTEHPEMEFVQLQINYLDWEDPFFQSRKLYETAKKFGKQILVMEPIKGGSLANLETFKIEGGFDKKTFAKMALKFVASLDVDIILSGMSALEHVVENRKTLAEPTTLSEDDKKNYAKVLEALKKARLIPCTTCRYCEAECPKKIAIPDILSLINLCGHTGEHDITYVGRFRIFYRSFTQKRGKASDCIACGKCANRCPQRINIPRYMSEASKLFENK